MPGLTINSGNLTITPNGFSTLRRYIRQVANPADATSAMVEGPSIVIAKVSGQGAINWRYEVGDLVVEGRAYSATGYGPYPAAGSTASKRIAI